jgi:hypothetical protein
MLKLSEESKAYNTSRKITEKKIIKIIENDSI